METTNPRCTCACCDVTARMPSEIDTGPTSVKCAAKAAGTVAVVKDGKDLQCKDQCTLDDPQVMMNLLSPNAFSGQFCFLECKPLDSEVGGKCTALSAADASLARTSDGGGTDIHASPMEFLPATPAPTGAPPLPQLAEDKGAGMEIAPAKPPMVGAAKVLKDAKDALVTGNTLQETIDSYAKKAKKHADNAETAATKTGHVVKWYRAPVQPPEFKSVPWKFDLLAKNARVRR